MGAPFGNTNASKGGSRSSSSIRRALSGKAKTIRGHILKDKRSTASIKSRAIGKSTNIKKSGFHPAKSIRTQYRTNKIYGAIKHK